MHPYFSFCLVTILENVRGVVCSLNNILFTVLTTLVPKKKHFPNMYWIVTLYKCYTKNLHTCECRKHYLGCRAPVKLPGIRIHIEHKH